MVVVAGAGVSGLTTRVALLETGFSVRLVAEEIPGTHIPRRQRDGGHTLSSPGRRFERGASRRSPSSGGPPRTTRPVFPW
ncbi:NAD(P)-binding protein [Streptomyces olindensis]|jgi:glycine/D-amino acid oxidase-like deaminating enzyme|uniref:NAD(P)-binding protein n=1 Tax=Streptomyces olindensis TaxID=358823 RepID=UPI00365B2DEB